MTRAANMLAVRASAPGDPAQVRATGTPRPAPRAGELLVRVRAAGVNRSDVLACRGTLPGPFPRTLGRDFAGTVVEGPAGGIAERVWRAGRRDVGLGRDGSHAQYLTVADGAACQVPAGLDLAGAAASALAYFTAWAAWDVVGGVEPGSTVLLTGAAGAVSAAAAALAARRSARVIGVVRRADDIPGSVDVVVRSDLVDTAEAIRRATAGAGAAQAVDTVGGPLTARLLDAMGVRGSVCVLSAPPTSDRVRRRRPGLLPERAAPGRAEHGPDERARRGPGALRLRPRFRQRGAAADAGAQQSRADGGGRRLLRRRARRPGSRAARPRTRPVGHRTPGHTPRHARAAT